MVRSYVMAGLLTPCVVGSSSGRACSRIEDLAVLQHRMHDDGELARHSHCGPLEAKPFPQLPHSQQTSGGQRWIGFSELFSGLG